MRYLFLIPARGGSKGIPGKNIRLLGGRPLIAHAVGQALELAEKPEDVVVTTDSEQIAEAAREAGASVPFLRPASLATDTSSSRDAILHALRRLEAIGRHYEAAVLLQPTSPLRTVADIRAAIAAFESAPEADMAVSVTEAAANPYYDAFETDADGHLHVSKGDGHYTRRQDAPSVWQYNGAVYVFRTESIRRMPMGSFPAVVASPMPRSRSIDLDTETDWLIAETLYEKQKRDETDSRPA